MNFKKENKNLNIALKNLLLNKNKKNIFGPKINQSRNNNLALKTSNNTSINKLNNKNIFIKKFPSKTIIPLNNYYNSLNAQSHSNRYNISRKINHKNINIKELSKKEKINNKYSSKNLITEKNPKISSHKKINKNINNIKYGNINNNLESYYPKNNDNNFIQINKNNNINNNKIKNKVISNGKKIFGIMLKKKSFINNNFLNHFNENNYYFYQKNLENNTSRNSSGSSFSLNKNISSSYSNKIPKKKSNYNKKNYNILKNNITFDYFNNNSRKDLNSFSYNCNNSTSHLTNIPHLNRISINKYKYNEKNPLKLTLIPHLQRKRLNVLQTHNNNNSNHNTINIIIDNSVNNIYDNVININKNPKITFIKVNNSKNKNIKKDIFKKNSSILFPRKKTITKSGSTNHSYQNIIMNHRERTKIKEKKHKNIGIIIKDNLKKIHEKKKKKQLLISLNNITSSKIKLLGIQEIFSNFSKIQAKNPKFSTPKLNTEFNNFNQINFSGRFNRTEDKNIDFFTSMSEKYKKIKVKEDPQYVYEYFYEILNNLLIDENNYFENLDFTQTNLFKSKNYINPDNRKFFINSLINLQELLNFNERTLFLTTQIFDRYINNVLIKKNIKINEENLDIVIVTSLIIASKSEEIKLYSMKDYLNLLPVKYNIHDLEKTEYEILSGFDFNLKIPGALDFYEIFSVEKKLNKFQLTKGLYLLNFILLDNNLVYIPSSLIAYAVIFIVSGKSFQFNKLCEEYKENGEKKTIKILSILKDREVINNLCGYIKYLYNINKNSIYNGPFNKFNTSNHYFVSSYLDI